MLKVRQSKFGKTRLVPFSLQLRDKLSAVEARNKSTEGCISFFVSPAGIIFILNIVIFNYFDFFVPRNMPKLLSIDEFKYVGCYMSNKATVLVVKILAWITGCESPQV